MAVEYSFPTAKALGYTVFGVVALLVVGSLFEGDEARVAPVRKDGTRAKKRPISKVAKKAARVAEKQGDTDLAGRLERGEIRGDQLAALMKSGTLRRKNPDAGLVAKAFEESEEFHGNKREVVELSEKDRYISPIGIAMGRLEAITYSVPNDSKRAGIPFEHISGDRGTWEPKATHKPLVVADAKTGRIHLIQDRSPMVFDPERGMVG